MTGGGKVTTVGGGKLTKATRIDMCIINNQGRFVRVRTERIEHILDVKIGEVIGLLSALKWVDELRLRNMDFEVDCKRVINDIYSNRTYKL
ncbi:cytochrome p450 [Trifolium pratense]|uniref:Cytochrome p450 n=1 Tax=Trifolium pratense TaxID=57577 RepID=A0A2K3P296_TRIPR|nr:cytochrome p450 [Trifolium pratense]